MKITLITVGKIKEKYLRDAIAEYSKRLSRYCKLEIIEVADEKTPDHASDVVENTIRDKEAERIMKYVKEDAYVITLEINGKLLSSEELSAKINQLGIGPGGLGGTTTALAVNINTYATHIAGLPVAVNICCHVNRHVIREV